MNKNKSLNLTKNISFLNLSSNTQKQCDFALDKAVLKQASKYLQEIYLITQRLVEI